MKQEPNTNLLCPFCLKEQDGWADDFAICGRIGPASKAMDNCVECDKKFFVTRNEDKSIEVTKP